VTPIHRVADRNDADALLNHFSDFYDACVVGVTLEHLCGLVADRTARIHIRARANDGSWARVDFTVSAVRSFRFEESARGSNVVLSLAGRDCMVEIHGLDPGEKATGSV
jgi:hypothetical protein